MYVGGYLIGSTDFFFLLGLLVAFVGWALLNVLREEVWFHSFTGIVVGLEMYGFSSGLMEWEFAGQRIDVKV